MKCTSAELALLAVVCFGLSGCLEVERARACNRMGQQIEAVFREPKRLASRAEIEQVAAQMDGLEKGLVAAAAHTPPAATELAVLRKELRDTSAELKRSLPWLGTPGGLAAQKRVAQSVSRLEAASQAFTRACH